MISTSKKWAFGEVLSTMTPECLPSSFFETPGFILLHSSYRHPSLASSTRFSIAGLKLQKSYSSLEELPELFSQLPLPSSKNLKSELQIPIMSGWLGYWGYDLASSWESRLTIPKSDLTPPFFWGYYTTLYVYDHDLKKAFIISDTEQEIQQYQKIIETNSLSENTKKEKLALGPITSNFDRSRYVLAIEDCLDHIQKGDFYQINLSQRFEVPVLQTPSPKSVYLDIVKHHPAPFAAFLNLEDSWIISSSPECFLKIEGSQISTRPIKGTRGILENTDELMHDSKERAELLMITDLERNDLGRICKAGSIQVTQMASLETFSHVHHLVATIEGELKDDANWESILKSLFPSGSVTGTPKLKAMEMIAHLEKIPRNVYCGAIGFIGEQGHSELNVAIRTLIYSKKNGKFYYSAGGGLVADSNPQKEYEETLLKAKGFFSWLHE